MPKLDILLAGGGLAAGLVALRLARLRPDVRVGIVEGGDTFGGNHIWSSFDSDMTPAQRAWTAPLYAHCWQGYAVAFPKRRRRIGLGYASATSQRLDAALRAALPRAVLTLGAEVASVDATGATLADGRRIDAGAVIDGRGPDTGAHLDLAWQKFVGLEVELEAPHGLAEPVVMDATVAQLDGYRFVYLLPFSPTRLLIEDTYYSDDAGLAEDAVEARIRAYAAGRGWRVASVERTERGVLPIALGGDIERFWDDATPGVARIGMRAALFHPTTGYSFPDAVRTADLIAALPSLDGASIHDAVRAASVRAWRERGFYRMLNLMLFRAAAPTERYKVLERFYGLGEPLIGRFYAAQSTIFDKARILAGKPPVSIGAALRAVTG